MAYTTINKSTDYFNTKLYAGTGSTHNVTGVGFQPDWTWIKSRTDTGNHRIYDAVRGATKTIYSNLTNEEGTNTNGLSSFDSDGFTVNTNTQSNGSGNNFASWNWKANGQGSSNTDGSINTTYTSANTTAGFSIVKYTGTGSAATVGHGLGAIPKMIIIKGLTNTTTQNWRVFHNNTSNGRLALNDNIAAANSTDFGANGSGGTITQNINYFNIGTDARVNGSGSEYIAYCFAEKTGYSKAGGFNGNGNADGVFQYCGFKPSFLLLKRSGDTANWLIFDNKREGYNVDNDELYPNTADVEQTYDHIDFLSNGFKLRANSSSINANASAYIWFAFGQSLVGNNNVPCTAR